MKYYLSQRDGSILKKKPLGWQNINDFLLQSCPAGDTRGCLAINSLRELSIVCSEAHDVLSSRLEALKRLIAKNVAATSVKANADLVADIILTFFTGLCMEQNLSRKRAASGRKIEGLMKILRQL